MTNDEKNVALTRALAALLAAQQEADRERVARMCRTLAGRIVRVQWAHPVDTARMAWRRRGVRAFVKAVTLSAVTPAVLMLESTWTRRGWNTPDQVVELQLSVRQGHALLDVLEELRRGDR